MSFSASQYSKALEGVSTEVVDKHRVEDDHCELHLMTVKLLDRVSQDLLEGTCALCQRLP